jgi:predicted transcriptional regulator
VLDFLSQFPYRNFTRSELSQEIPLRLSSVCGRVNKLLALGLISERTKRACSITGKTISPVRIVRAEVFQH